jgi:hypothetical protein
VIYGSQSLVQKFSAMARITSPSKMATMLPILTTFFDHPGSLDYSAFLHGLSDQAPNSSEAIAVDPNGTSLRQGGARLPALLFSKRTL